MLIVRFYNWTSRVTLGAILLAFVQFGLAKGASGIEISHCPPEQLELSVPALKFKRCEFAVWLSGEFEPGDYNDLKEFIQANFDDLFLRVNRKRMAVLLNSHGGDVFEAMKIGRLFRKLGFTTILAEKVPGETVAEYFFQLKPHDESWNYCVGACVYAWLGGAERLGSSSLVLHSIPDDFSELDLGAQGVPQSPRELGLVIYQYLEELSVDLRLFSKIIEAPSRGGLNLTREYISNHLRSPYGQVSEVYCMWHIGACYNPPQVAHRHEMFEFFRSELGKDIEADIGESLSPSFDQMINAE